MNKNATSAVGMGYVLPNGENTNFLTGVSPFIPEQMEVYKIIY
jgi:hypothetical protein